MLRYVIYVFTFFLCFCLVFVSYLVLHLLTYFLCFFRVFFPPCFFMKFFTLCVSSSCLAHRLHCSLTRLTTENTYLGQILQDRENGCVMSIFKKVGDYCGQRYWWLLFICTDLLWVLHAFKIEFHHSFPRKPIFMPPSTWQFSQNLLLF